MKIDENRFRFYESNLASGKLWRIESKPRNVLYVFENLTSQSVFYFDVPYIFLFFLSLSLVKYARRNSYRIIDLSVVKRVHRKLTITRGRRMDHDRITPISSASAQSSGYRECDRLSRCIGINWNRLEILLLANTTKHDNPVTWAFISKDFPISSWYQEQ